jgi:co-chaperonin GroES (HSP10)
LIKPLEDKVVLELPKQEEKTTQFGLIIAGTAEEKPSEGIVAAVGPGPRFADGSIKSPGNIKSPRYFEYLILFVSLEFDSQV